MFGILDGWVWNFGWMDLEFWIVIHGRDSKKDLSTLLAPLPLSPFAPLNGNEYL